MKSKYIAQILLLVVVWTGIGAQAQTIDDFKVQCVQTRQPSKKVLSDIDELRIEAMQLLVNLGTHDCKGAYRYITQLSDQDVMQLLSDLTFRPDPNVPKIEVRFGGPDFPSLGLEGGGGK